ncbi:MAG: hypothetical protein EA381_00310 [Planctomycetaceae bacterium]|nr:MAG: hypothetical protein EA381_00310 [Planctomycetaceae bacterium]
MLLSFGTCAGCGNPSDPLGIDVQPAAAEAAPASPPATASPENTATKLISTPNEAEGEDWQGFRGPGGMGFAQRGTAFCADGKTGELIYEQRLDRAGQVYASAITDGEHIYYVARDGKTFVVRATPELEQVAMNELSDGTNFDASPAIDGSRLLIRSNRFLYSIGSP